MPEEKIRVDFNAPASLVERADQVADVLDVSRTSLLIDALEDELEEITGDETFRRRLGEAYYDDRVDFESVESILGREEAMRMKLLKESIDWEPTEPTLADNLPSNEEFYDGPVPEWTPDKRSADDE